MKIKIYEFSIGIKVAGSPDNWYSQGFTGDFMNKTYDPIPVAIQEAISHQLFAVAECGGGESQTLIGRVIQDNKGEWSVLAVVTRERDEWKRPFSAYRYFWCEGSDKLDLMLKWWNSRKLVFDPFEFISHEEIIDDQDKEYREPDYDITSRFTHLLDEELPLPVIPDFNSNIKFPLIIHKIAETRARTIKQLVAWAYKVEGLEAPRSFQVIYPASQEAQDILRRVLANQPVVLNIVSEEKEIKKAISLLSQDKRKEEYLQIINKALKNDLINDKYWQAMFDSQGATDAIKQGNYSPQTVRLLTLRAMVLPETLPQFLDWLGVRNKKDDCWKNCLDFQATVLGYLSELPQLAQKLLEGVRFIITQLLEKPERLGITAWLLISDDGCWSELYKKSFRKDLDNDLRTRKNYTSKNSFLNDDWDKVMSDLFRCLQTNHHYKLQEYFVFANLFYLTKDYPIAAVFCYASMGNIPQELFNQLNPNNNYSTNVYGLTVYRQLSILEQIGGFIVPVYLVIPALMAFLLLGFFGRSYIPAFRSPSESSIDNTAQYLAKKLNPTQPEQSTVKQQLIKVLNDDQLKKNADLSKNLTCAIKDQESKNAVLSPDEYYCKISAETLDKGIKGFATTIKTINFIVSEMSKIKDNVTDNPYQENKVYSRIAEQLGVESDILNNAVSYQDLNSKKRVIYAIYLYQKRNGINSPNGILGDKTKNKILEEIKPKPSPKLSPFS